MMVLQHNPDEILSRIDLILAKDPRFTAFPPKMAKKVVVRVFKLEGEAELWAGDEHLQLVSTLNICAMDREPGPKLREGDGKTPEGFYTLNFEHGFASQMWFMWIDLDDLNRAGEVGRGSVFKTFVTYPQAIDYQHANMAGFSNPGSAIFCHGNCVSAGCVSFKNPDYLPIFSYTRHAFLNGPKNAEIHVFPFRFDQKNMDVEAKKHGQPCGEGNRWCKHVMTGFWQQLELGFQTFNETPRLLNFSFRPRRLKLGESGSFVAELCERMNVQSKTVFDPDLQIELRNFQREKGLTVDGLLGPKTMQALEIYPFTYSFE